MTNPVDFKDCFGKWVSRFKTDEGRLFTRSGMLYHALKQRVNPNGKKQKESPLYKGCYSSFIDYQDFAEWCQYQIGYKEGYHLDKDLLIKGNKEYGKHTCVFLPQEINKLLTKRDRCRGQYPLGVQVDTRNGYNYIRASCQIGTGVAKFLGHFDNVVEAFAAYKNFKEAFMKQQANKWKDQIDPRAYKALINYEVLITD